MAAMSPRTRAASVPGSRSGKFRSATSLKWATVSTVAGALSVGNGTRSRWLVPLPGDDLGPVALRPGRLGDQRQGAVKRLALVGADGHVLLHVGRSE